MAVWGCCFAATMGCAHAQAEVDARIKDAFALVPGNPVDLAVPLTRRALARRSVREFTTAAGRGGQAGSVPPLKLLTTRQGDRNAGSRTTPVAAASDDVTAWLAKGEEGSAPREPARRRTAQARASG